MKYKVPLCILLVLLQLSIAAQQHMPVIRSHTRDVVIKYNDDLRINWYLQPGIKPDVFTIGSTLREKKIRFVTDVDSVEYDVQAGRQYDFIIMLNDKQPCYTRITALNDPLLLQKRIGIPVLAGILLLLVFSFIKRKRLPVKFLLWLGIITPLAFLLITVAAGFLHGNYNHLKQAVSELGNIGAQSETFMAIGTLLLAISSLYFSTGFYAASKKLHINVIPAVLSFAMAVSFAWAAVFPSGHELHGTLGPLPLLVMLGALLVAFLWRNDKRLTLLRWLSLLSFFVMLLFVLCFIPVVQQQYEGMVQRFLYLGWAIWFVSLSTRLRKLPEIKKNNVYN
jgi:hypothetical membrane protein